MKGIEGIKIRVVGESAEKAVVIQPEMPISILGKIKFCREVRLEVSMQETVKQ